MLHARGQGRKVVNQANWDKIAEIVGGLTEPERDLLNRLQFALAKFTDAEYLQLLVLIGSKFQPSFASNLRSLRLPRP
jgi:hypothetical protein